MKEENYERLRQVEKIESGLRLIRERNSDLGKMEIFIRDMEWLCLQVRQLLPYAEGEKQP